MSNPQVIRNFTAGSGGVRQYRIGKLGATDGEAVEATAVGDTLIGVSVQPGTAAQGQRVDLAIDGVAEVEFGGTVTRGAYLTTDSQGRAVAAAPAAGVNNGIVGIALVSAVVGDIGPAMVRQGRIQG